MSNNQPTWDFSLYDSSFPRHAPDMSTPARKAAVAFENSVRCEPIENGAFFQPNGTLILKKTGFPNRIPFSVLELSQTTGSLFSHNHPDGNSFSVPDVMLAISLRLIELRAVAPHWRHRMKPIVSWPSEAAVSAAVPAGTSRGRAAVHAMMQSGQLSSQFCLCELQHQIWLYVSRSLKFEYSREAS